MTVKGNFVMFLQKSYLEQIILKTNVSVDIDLMYRYRITCKKETRMRLKNEHNLTHFQVQKITLSP